MGVVDEEYVLKAFDVAAVVGRKIILASDEVSALVGVVEKLGRRLFDGVMGAKKPPDGLG
jgi:hypothetical protein